MQRRAFLASATVGAGAMILPFQSLRAAASSAQQLQLWSSTASESGSLYRPHGLQACPSCAADTLQVHIDGLFPAATGAQIESLNVHALFDLPQGETVPFHAWQFASQPLASRSGPVQFVAGRVSMRRLEIDFRLVSDAQSTKQECALTRFESPLLSPGHYLLLSPRQSGASLAGLRLEHSGDPLAPLTDLATRDFDYFAFRIQALA